MSKRKTYEIFLSTEDRIDVDLEFRKATGTAPRLARFAIAYSARIRGRWREVVRYDNFHGAVHRQRYWRTGEPERVPTMERLPPAALLDRMPAPSGGEVGAAPGPAGRGRHEL